MNISLKRINRVSKRLFLKYICAIEKLLREAYQSLFPYRYKETRYLNTFLTNFSKRVSNEKKLFPTRIVCFWTGDNAMSDARMQCYKELFEKSGVSVLLINKDNLAEYVLKEFPLHTAYNSLSLVHRSDYLRCYFMHHYGGGYSDIKSPLGSWEKAFQILQNSEKDILGYSEISHNAVAVLGGDLGKDLKKYYLKLIGNCSYICRPYSAFTTEWYSELNKRLDEYYPKLMENPGNVMGDNIGYPIPWTGILGDIFHPLCLKYSNDIIKTDIIKPSFENYR